MEVDSNYLISDMPPNRRDFTLHDVASTKDLTYTYRNLKMAEGTFFIWKFVKDCTFRRDLTIKYSSLDELFSNIGSIIEMVLMIFAFFIIPFAQMNFVMKN